MASQFNRATQALRQPGSTFKVFAYAAALEEGHGHQQYLGLQQLHLAGAAI
jgi:membrane carboxypeptidase/penicillin-binding protein